MRIGHARPKAQSRVGNEGNAERKRWKKKKVGRQVLSGLSASNAEDDTLKSGQKDGDSTLLKGYPRIREYVKAPRYP